MDQEEALRSCGLPQFPYNLDKWQIEALESVGKGKSLLVCWPTGCGKTTVALGVCGKAKLEGKKTIVLVPLKSLNAEHAETFSKYFKTGVAYGDDRKDLDFFRSDEFREIDVLISTYETFDSILNNPEKAESVMSDIYAVVIDEIHAVGDKGRGANLESAITLLLVDYPDVLRYGLSATIGNMIEFAEWLEADLNYVPQENRPIPLKKTFLVYDKEYWDFGDEHIPNVNANMNKRMLMVEQIVKRHLKENGDATFIIFTTSRERTIQVANNVNTKILGAKKFYNEDDAITMVEETRVGFHNASLDAEQREMIEQAFRTGKVRIICSTPTLAQGVNLPADVCIIFDIDQWDQQSGTFLIDANRLQQTIGRAGRRGLSKCGYAYIISHRDRYAKENYIASEFTCGTVNVPEEILHRAEKPLIISSKLKPRLHEKILRWVSSGRNTNVEISQLCVSAFAKISEEESKGAVDWLSRWGFLQPLPDHFVCSYKGRMCSRFYLTPETIHSWEIQASCADPEKWKETFVRFTANEEYQSSIVVRKEDSEIINVARLEIDDSTYQNRKCPSVCLTCTSKVECPDANIRLKNCEQFELQEDEVDLRTLKTFVLTFSDDLIEKYDLYKRKKNGEYLKDKFGNKKPSILLSHGDKNKLQSNAQRFFTVAKVIFNKNQSLSDTLQDLSIMGNSGCMNRDEAILRRVKGIGPAIAKKLISSGVKTIGDFISADTQVISGILNKAERVVEALKQNARIVVSERENPVNGAVKASNAIAVEWQDSN